MTASNSPGVTRVKRRPDQLMRGRERAALLILLPLLLLALAYVALAVRHGTPWLWGVVVHESGRYTLAETMLYLAHFMREVPTDLAMALFLVAALRRVDLLPSPNGRPLSRWALGLAALLVGVGLTGAALDSGLASALRDLAQFRTRDELSAYGSHWRFHWLSTIWFASGATVVARWAAGQSPSDPLSANRESRRLWTVAWIYFAGLTAIFGLSWEIVADPRFVGHQAREILTHGPITCLLVVGSALALAPAPSIAEPFPPSPRPVLGRLAAIAFILVPIGLLVLARTGDAMASAQMTHGLTAVVAAHAFEHTLDYVLVWLLVFGIGNRLARI
jgi:hypothetical protein